MNASAKFLVSLIVAFVGLLGIRAQDGAKKDAPPELKNDPAPEARKVYRHVSAEKLEAIFKALGVDAQQVKSKKNDGVVFYEYRKNDFPIRLHCYKGNDLWIDSQVTDKLSLEEVNAWNRRAKFTRAVLLKSEKNTVSLEAQLDCVGGVTDGIIRQFLERFDGELAQFSKFVSK